MLLHSSSDLSQDLRRLGVQAGDTLFVHSSYKSLGPVRGGAIAVIAALEDASGPDGLLLMPSFNLVAWEDLAATWDPAATPSTVGWITEQFRLLPRVYRSDHYSHSVAARGNGAESFVGDHLSQEGCFSPWDLKPWGTTYGTNSPMYRAYRARAKLLMLGVDYLSSTFIHLVEVIYWNKQHAASLVGGDDPPFLAMDRRALGVYWERTGTLCRGSVGDADCRLFSARDYVDALLTEVERNAELYLV